MLLIKNTHMTDPASGTDAYKDILIQDEKIIKIADSIPETEAAVFSGEKEDMLQIINAEGMIAAPGLVDAMCISGIPVLRKRNTLTPAPERQRQEG